MPDVSCVQPRGKCDIEFWEGGVVFRPRPAAATAAAKAAAAGAAVSGVDGGTATPVVVHASNVTGVFYLTAADRYKKGPAGVNHMLVLTLAAPVLVGKTEHRALGMTETGEALTKAGACTIKLRRAPAPAGLRDVSQLGAAALAGGGGAGAPVTGEHRMAVLRSLLGSVLGRVGEADKAIFASSHGDGSVKCYHKVNDGALYPLRRCLLFGPRPIVCVPHTDIASVTVGRGGGSGAARTFDLDVKLRDGKMVQFGMIEIEELDALRAYVGTRTFGTTVAADGRGTRAPAAASAASSDSVAPLAAGSFAAASARAEAAAPATSSSADGEGSTVAAAAGAPAPPVAVNMNELDSDQGSDGGGEAVDGDDESDSSFSSGGDESDDEEDEDDEENDGDEGGGVSSSGSESDDEEADGADPHTARRVTGKKRKALAAVADGRASAADEEDDDDDDVADDDDEEEDEGDELSEDELNQLLEDAGTTTAEARLAGGRPIRSSRRAAAGGAGASASASASAGSAAGGAAGDKGKGGGTESESEGSPDPLRKKARTS
jgi:hypothetical protein